MRNETKMTAVEFGKALINSGDLDPIYFIFNADVSGVELSEVEQSQFLLAYWFFYHAGVASFLSGGTESWFYERCERTFDQLPRGTERRHFRGTKALDAILLIQQMFPKPQQVVEYVYQPTFQETKARVLKLPMFGDWIAFKVADMIERCLRREIDFSDCELGFYETPAAAAPLIAPQIDCDPTVEAVAEKLNAILGENLAPPFFDRRVNLQEIETIMCKYKSYLKGSYFVGKDFAEILHHFDGWGNTAERLKKGLTAYFEKNCKKYLE